jgi:lipid A 4'-phosphatase
MRRDQLHPLLMIIGLGIAYAAFFFLRPETDLTLARHLYDTGFFLKEQTLIQLSYKCIAWVTRAIIIGAVAALVWKAIKFRKLHRPALFILISLALGPGLLVHTVFKDNWGRARPSQIVEFGGSKQYSPPFVIAGQCEKNCSFVSGHAAIGFFICAFALFFKGWRRTAIYTGGVLFGLWIGFIRMAMGGHFFSDVIFAGIFVLLVVHLVYYFMFKNHEAA